MADIFGRSDVGFGGAFKSSLAQIKISGDGGDIDKLLITNLQATYQQPLNRIFEISSDKSYFVVGRTQGNGSIGAVFGPKRYAQAAYTNLADPCTATDVLFKFDKDASCDESGNPTGRGWGRKLVRVILQSLAFQVNAQDMLINENLGFQFASMETV